MDVVAEFRSVHLALNCFDKILHSVGRRATYNKTSACEGEGGREGNDEEMQRLRVMG